MYSVFNKAIIVCGAIIIASSTLSCNNINEERAKEYLAEASRLSDSGDYVSALSVLDSLDVNCADRVDRRRDGMIMRPRLIEGATLQKIAVIDSVIAELTLESEAYKEKLVHVKDAFEGYYTTKELAGVVPSTVSGLYTRMSPDGVLTVIASSTRKSGSKGVTVFVNGSEASTPMLEPDGERNDRSRGVEIITFMPIECDTLGHFAAIHRGEKLTLRFNGDKPYTMTLDQSQAIALADVYEASILARKLRLAHIEKVMLEKKLQVARGQMARNYDESGVEKQKD